MQLKALTKYSIIFLFLILVLPKSASAQNNILDVTVSPVFFDFSNSSGSKINDKIRIRNNTTSPIDLKISVGKLGPTEDGVLTIIEPKPEDNYINWLKFENQNITASPQEWTDIPFSIDIPSDAAFGYYWAVSIEQAKAVSNDENAAKVSGAAAIPILLNVKKDGAKTQAEIVEFKSKSFINQFLPVDFQTMIKNTGNVHIRPVGNIFISGQGQKDIAILDVNPESGTILPSATREFANSWTDGFLVYEPVVEDDEVKTDENGAPVTKLKINWDKLTHFRFGPYSATLVMVFDDGTRDVLIESKADFWVIPYIPVAIILGSLLIIFFLLKFILQSYINSQIRKRSR